ncbi:MAG: transglutaminase domain-containing protein, partial [Candidatus Latescibacteria bacterium]|nr:transglutaminase domain-containing protein [Candidatus Latescibacterota bacterium]
EEGLDITRSIDILRLKRGACDEYTKLFTALARSIGIPTLVNLGYVYRAGAFRYHSWPTVFIGGMWHDLDPFFGQDSADATHVAIVRGGFDKIIELLRIQGKMSISVLDAR